MQFPPAWLSVTPNHQNMAMTVNTRKCDCLEYPVIGQQFSFACMFCIYEDTGRV